jgi:phosphate transport system permease protein
MKTYLGRKAINLVGLTLATACLILAIVPLGAMMFYVLGHGGASLNLDFFTKTPAPVGEPGGGVLNDIQGTVYLIALASIIGMPVGIGSGVYLSRSTNKGFANTVRFFTDVVAGTPSIVAGVVAYALVVIPTGHFSAIAGGVALGLLMFPTVTRATEEAVKLVPPSIREAGLALGIPEWQTMVRIILPAAANGIVTAVMLGIARVSGETAPLLFTAFGNDNIDFNPNGQVGALPIQIWRFATSPYADWQRQAWGGAFVLFAIIVVLNLSARVLTLRLTARVGSGD